MLDRDLAGPFDKRLPKRLVERRFVRERPEFEIKGGLQGRGAAFEDLIRCSI
jgi:hypothetical protein